MLGIQEVVLHVSFPHGQPHQQEPTDGARFHRNVGMN
jgi:hypothetical protein